MASLEKFIKAEEASDQDVTIKETDLSNEMLLENSSLILKKFGKFQIRSILLFCPTFLYLGMYVLGPIFLNAIPDHKCRQPQYNESRNLSDSNLEYIQDEQNFNLTKNSCKRFKYVTTEKLNGTETTLVEESCLHGWIYDLKNGRTIVSKFHLVCNSAWKRPLTISVSFFGMMIGGTFGGQLSDRFGRRRTCLSGVFLTTVFTFVESFAFNYWFYICNLFVTGVAYSVSYYCTYTWAQELVSSGGKRAIAALALNASFASGGMLLSLITLAFPDWDWLKRIMGFLSGASFALMWMVSESPKWLLQSNKSEEFASLLKQIARVNNISIKTKSSDFRKPHVQKEESGSEVEIGLLWRNSVLRRRLFLVCSLWSITFLSFYTMALNSANLGGSSNINNLIGCLLDVFSALVVTLVMKKFGRKYPLAVALGVVGLFCVVSPKVNEANHTAGIVTAMVGRLFATSSMSITILYTGEIFPTLQRNTSVSIASMIARTSCLLSPFLIFAGEEIDLSIPFYVMGGMSTIAVYLTLLLPETSKTLLPNTLEEALALKDPRLLVYCRKLPRTQSKHKNEIGLQGQSNIPLNANSV